MAIEEPKHIILGCKITDNNYNQIVPVVIFTSKIAFTIDDGIITGQDVTSTDLKYNNLNEPFPEVNLLVVTSDSNVYFIVGSNIQRNVDKNTLTYHNETNNELIAPDKLKPYFEHLIETDYIKIYDEIQSKYQNLPDYDKGKSSMRNLYTLITKSTTAPSIIKTIYNTLYNPIIYMFSSLSVNTLIEMKNMNITFGNRQSSVHHQILNHFFTFSYITFTEDDIDSAVWNNMINQIFIDKTKRDIFKNDIAKDIEIYSQYHEQTPTIALHITRFIELLNNINNPKTTMATNDIHNKDNILLYSKFILAIYNKFRDMTYYPDNKINLLDYLNETLTKEVPMMTISQEGKREKINFLSYLTAMMTDESSSTILTYLKINNTESSNENEKTENYNLRFKVELNQEASFTPGTKQLTSQKSTYLKLGYNDDEFAYYTDNGSNICNPNMNILRQHNLNNKFDLPIDQNATGLFSVKHKYTYIFGKFNEIFPYHKLASREPMKNKDISEKMSAVIEKLQLGKPVFIIGYGASGAGKTSALINFKKEEGILIELCNQLTKVEFHSNGKNANITKVGIIVKEYYVDYKQPDNYNEYIYTVKGDTFIYSKTLSHNATSKDGGTTAATSAAAAAAAAKSVNAIQSIHKYRTTEEFDPKNKTMGELLVYLVDTDRLVKATTNNPQSSRSHVLVFVKLYDANNVVGNLIVGDFAGVENKFQCQDPNTLQKFLNIPSTDPSKENQPFYSTLVQTTPQSNNAVDPKNLDPKNLDPKNLDPDTNVQEISQIDSVSFNNNDVQCKLDYIMNPNPIYDFTFNNLTFRKNVDNNTKYVISGILQKLLPTYSDELDTTDVYKQLLETKNHGIIKTNYEGIIKHNKGTTNNIQSEIKEDIQNKINKDIPEKIKELIYKYILLPSGREYNDGFMKEYNDATTAIKDIKKGTYGIEQSIYNSIDEELTNHPLSDQYTTLKKEKRKSSSGFANKYFFKEGASGNILTFVKYLLSRFNGYDLDNSITELSNFNRKSYTFYVINTPYEPAKPTVPAEIVMTLNDISTLFMEKEYAIFKYIYDLKNITHPIVQLKYTLNYVYNNMDDKNVTDFFTDCTSIYEIIQETICRLQYGQFICDNRLKEGVYINSTLAIIRKTIQTILTKKKALSHSIMHSPNIVHECLETYCPSGQNCFAMPKTTVGLTPNVPDLITEIYHTISAGDGPTPPLDKFYEDITICLFGVFNISRCANNPPPIQYIDINKLKQLIYYTRHTSVDKNELIKSYTENVKKLYSDIRRFKMTDLVAYKILKDDLPVDLLDDFEIIPITVNNVTDTVERSQKGNNVSIARTNITLTINETDHTANIEWITIRGKKRTYNLNEYLVQQREGGKIPGSKNWTINNALNYVETNFKFFSRDEKPINIKRNEMKAWGKIGNTIFVEYADSKNGILISDPPSTVEKEQSFTEEMLKGTSEYKCTKGQCRTIYQMFDEIIEDIDVSNAASAVGVLEFLDQMAKFTSTRTLCLPTEAPHNNEDN